MTQLKTGFLRADIWPQSMQVVLPYLAVAFTLLVTLFYHSTLKQRHGDARGTWLYFLAFFGLTAALPILLITVVEEDPLQVLHALGISLGNFKIGMPVIVVFVPISMLIGHVVSKTEAMKEWYPFSKEACARDGTFLVYEIGYVLLYYTAWEFLYRGILFFPLMAALGFVPAMALNTALSTLHHIGHPKTEILGALVAGIVFSTIALLTRSVLYAIVVHALVGVANDTFIYLRSYRRGTGR